MNNIYQFMNEIIHLQFMFYFAGKKYTIVHFSKRDQIEL